MNILFPMLDPLKRINVIWDSKSIIAYAEAIGTPIVFDDVPPWPDGLISALRTFNTQRLKSDEMSAKDDLAKCKEKDREYFQVRLSSFRQVIQEKKDDGTWGNDDQQLESVFGFKNSN